MVEFKLSYYTILCVPCLVLGVAEISDNQRQGTQLNHTKEKRSIVGHHWCPVAECTHGNGGRYEHAKMVQDHGQIAEGRCQ